MELTYTVTDKTAAKMNVSDAIFGREFNEGLVHQAVTAYLAGGRAGTAAQKSRSYVRGGGAKPWKQKGTGRARAGTIRSPLWRGGAKIFPACTQNWSQKLNKKMYRAAMQTILSELLRQDRLVVVEKFEVAAAKTKGLLAQLNTLGLHSVMLVTEQIDTNMALSARNLPNVGVCDAAAIDPVSLVGFEKVLITVPALKKLEEMFA
ncbi:MAG: 50S ribosomal protein L4 [Gammaproteobacteria bacterium]|nr:50S ribosomal protein L4 [Gammaproteobacteria bacterium]